MINYLSNGKDIIHLIVGLIKKTLNAVPLNELFYMKFPEWVFLMKFPCIKMSQYFPKTFKSFEGNINVKVDLSNYATKSDIKNISHVDTSGFALKTNVASLKTEVDKLDIDKLVPVLVDLSKLSDVVKNDVVKKDSVW